MVRSGETLKVSLKGGARRDDITDVDITAPSVRCDRNPMDLILEVIYCRHL